MNLKQAACGRKTKRDLDLVLRHGGSVAVSSGEGVFILPCEGLTNERRRIGRGNPLVHVDYAHPRAVSLRSTAI